MFMIQYIFIPILFFIYIHYWRRNREEIMPNWPIIGMVPTFVRHVSDFHDFTTLVLKCHGGTFRFQGPWFTNTSFIATTDPMDIDHIANKNFSNYGKGTNYHEIFDIFGEGMLNSDSDDWKQKRTLHHSILKMKSFKKMFHQTIQKKVENCLLPFLKNVWEEGVVVDLQDVFNRFTFDTNCTILLGFDPNTLPNKFSELREIAYQKSLPVIEEVIFYRHFIPTCLWKLQKWFHIGQEKKLNIAQQNLDRFLYESITFSKQQQSKCSSSEKNDDFDLLKVLEKEGYGKGKLGDKYLRDFILNLLMAGNSTISSGLSWFFWLVSIHPIVEAKIIQEIKDNCFTQNENWSISRLEDNLDKLVYLHGAICEALRLYPPVPFEHMCAIKSNILPSGVHVSENTKVMYHLYAMGRTEHIWGKDCMEFKPERWISEMRHIIHVPSYKFIAFNTGPRSCMGKDISFFEMKMVAASILWKFHIQVVEGHPVTPLLSIILRMKHGLKVKLTKRCI